MRMNNWCAAIAFLLCGAMAAQAELVELYSPEDYKVQGSGSIGKTRSQRFNATMSTPNSVPAGNYFDKAAMRLNLDPGECWTFRIRLFAWNTNIATTLAGTPIATSADVTYTGPDTQWLEITFPAQPVAGDYLLSLYTVSMSQMTIGYGIYESNQNDGGPNQDAYSDTGLKTDREWQVRLNVVANPSCVSPSGISMLPYAFSTPPSPGVQLLTISGTNLDLVSEVQLDGPATVPGDIVTQTTGEITANFDLSTAPIGSYRMVGVRDLPCSNALQDGAVTITCSQANTTVTSYLNGRGKTGTAAHKLELIGTNLDRLTGVKLVKSRNGPAEIDGTGLALLPSGNLEVTFDLTGAEGGQYDLVFTLDHPCASVVPASYPRGFLVYMPALTNGGFEVGYLADPTEGTICESSANGARPKPTHWDEGQVNIAQHDFVRDGKIWIPCVPNPAPPPAEIMGGVSGNHYASEDANNSNHATNSFFQTIAAPDVDVSGTSAKDYSVYADMAMRSCAQSSWGWIRLHDGSYTDPVIAETIIMNTDLWYAANGALVRSEDFKAVVPAGTVYASDPPVLTIEFVLETADGDTCTGNGLKALHVDAVRNTFVPPPPCQTVRQDVDGDNDVDLLDFAVFRACFNGSNRPYALPPGFDQDCRCLDVDPAPGGDGDLDLLDFARFRSCFNGENHPPASNCGL